MSAMKKMSVLLVVLLSMTQAWSQGTFRLPLIGDKAPSFTAKTTNGEITFPEDYGKNWKILFSHPQDFTPVCSTELLELARLQEDFSKLNVNIAVISTDELDRHLQWKKALEELEYNGAKGVKINFPIIEDVDYSICQKYGMIHSSSASTKAVRGVYIIDPDNVVQSVNFYPMTIGRNINEIIRTVEALQITASNEVLTPANWTVGKDLLVPYFPDSKDNKVELEKDGYYSLSWFLMFKKAKKS
jgi:peroxiredoxin 2/4